MKTIRGKLILIFSSFMLLLVALGIILNLLFLEKYYIYRNKEIFIECAENLALEYKKDPFEAIELMKLYDQRDSISSIITSPKKEIFFTSFPHKSARRLPREIDSIIPMDKGRLIKLEIYTKLEASSDKAPKLYYVTQLKNNQLLILSKPMKGIIESVSIANKFYIYSGGLIILIGSIIIYFLSKLFSKIFIEISETAEDISNLNFSKKITYNSSDEIGQLCQSINKISEKLSLSITELKMDVERRKTLVRNLSHELKTPIGIIKGYAEGLKFGVASSKEQIEKYCGVIVKECDIMDNMIRGLLKLSKLESGIFELNISQVNLNKLIEKILGRFEYQIKEKNITLKYSPKADIELACDKELIESAINNYITNAISYCNKGGAINVSLSEINGSARVEVANTGVPIPENEMKNIWDIFYKSDKARTRDQGGHGLGLSIVRLITELHEGKYGAENRTSMTMFYLEIPKNIKKGSDNYEEKRDI